MAKHLGEYSARWTWKAELATPYTSKEKVMPIDRKFRNLAIVAMYVSPGVKVDGGGFVIVNGKIVKVPPRGPVMQALQQAIKGVMALAKEG